MITDLLLDLVTTVLHAVLSLLPAWSPAAGMTSDLTDWLASAWSAAGGLHMWLPTGVLVAALALVLGAVAVAVAVKVVRIIASFMTAGGGSAA
jgi:hypothetical protein